MGHAHSHQQVIRELKKHPERAELLLEKGEVDMMRNGVTLLHHATYENENKVVASLLKHGADPNIKTEIPPMTTFPFEPQVEGKNALQIAQLKHHKELIKVLKGWRSMERLFKKLDIDTRYVMKFQEHKITLSTLKNLTADDLVAFIPEVGPRNILAGYIERLRKVDEEKGNEDFYEVRYPRGVALVVGNGNSGEVQISCHEDAKKMAELLTKIGYDVKVCYDVSRKDFLGIVHEISIDDHDEYDSFILYFSGHGGSGPRGEGIIYGGDKEEKTEKDEVKIEALVGYFQPESCPSLCNKPKIFLWDCCRGAKDARSKGWDTMSSVNFSSFLPPKFADFLYGYSSAPDYKSYAGMKARANDVTKGLSVWTYCLINNILNNKQERHFTDVLTKVQRDVPDTVKKINRNWQQAPNHVSFLTKFIRL